MRRRVPLLSALAGVALALAPSVARATPSSRLVYSRAGEGEACPDESALRKAVAARVGYDPFFPWAKRTVTVEIRSVGKKLVARVTLVDEAGIERGNRELESKEKDCAELVSSVALAVSIALDSLPPDPKADDPESGPPPAEPPPPPPPAPVQAEKPPPPPPPPPSPIGWAIAAGLHGAAGTAPSVAPGVTVSGEATFGKASLGLEGRYDFAASTSAPGVTTQLLGATLLPCAGAWVVYGCVTGSLGATLAKGYRLPVPETASALFASVGLRAGVDIPVVGPLGLRVYVDGAYVVTSADFREDVNTRWTTPSWAGSLGALARVRFP